MLFYRAILTALMLASFSGMAFGQQTNPGDRDPSGRIFTRLVVTITGEAGAFGHPVSDLRFLAVTEGGDRVSVRTNDAGVASAWLFPGSYRFVTPESYEYDGNRYTWDAAVSIRQGVGLVRLSQSNASKIEAIDTPSAAGRPTSRDARPPTARSEPVQSDSINSVTQGFFLAPHLLGLSLATEGEPIETGSGFGLTLGFGVSRLVAIFATIDLGKVDIRDPNIEGNYGLGHADLGARVNFREPTKKAIPYVDAAATVRLAQTTIEGIDFSISGAAFSLGGGLNYHFQPQLALDVGLLYSFGEFDTLEIDGEDIDIEPFSATGARFRLGLTWYASGGPR